MLSIAQAAAKTGLATSAIRYYEDQGLLTVKPWRKAGRRYYDPSVLGELALLGDLRRAGMTLADIKEFQALRQKAGPCSALSALAAERAKLLRSEILALRQAEARLVTFAKSCNLGCGDGRADGCSELDTIKT